MKFTPPIAAVIAVALLAALVLSGCQLPTTPPADGPQNGAAITPIPFASGDPPSYSRQELCSMTCDEFDYNAWEVKVDSKSRYSCTCSKEVCRREETPTAVYKYCNDIEYAFYFSG